MGTYGAFQEIIKKRIKKVGETKLEEYLNKIPIEIEAMKEPPKKEKSSSNFLEGSESK